MGNISVVNLTVYCASLALIGCVLILIRRKNESGKRDHFITAAALVHFVGICESLYVEFLKAREYYGSEMVTHRAVLIVMGLLCILLLLLSILTESDGRARLLSRTEPLNIGAVIACMLPLASTLTIELLTDDMHITSFGTTIALLMVFEMLEDSRYKELVHKEQTLNIRQAKLMTEQMQPHFIYNSLMSIDYLIRTDPDAAAKCLENFTGYLRGNIDALTSEEPIPFSRELEHIKQYISLERAGTDREFSVELELDAGDFKVPSLTVQPIVENAVKHGALSRKDGSGRVRIVTENIGQYVRITITDNGIGAAMTEKQQHHRNVGVNNARSRLETQCGGSLTVSYTDGGTRAVITVPREAM